ncbi:arginyl-tRNA synthetase [Apostasia shenzhenica]|uniref:arginine--tRNA ligase n=1 Tax=Apostasia shenzhenica TaxID=1088818 RepID=A0A2I0BH53_9ASPA|nr:arginyl-tRNA synthetase [Apostasia shenzhenica]
MVNINLIVLSQAARKAGWLPPAESNLYPKTSHVGFGLVLGSDGKRFRTRSSEVVRLVELLDEAKSRSKAELVKRLEDNGNLKIYADLKNNRLTNYTFSFDQMLNDKSGTLVLGHPEERVLGLHLIQFAEVPPTTPRRKEGSSCASLDKKSPTLALNKVIGSTEETSRLLLCEATAVVMRQCFYLLGITPVYKL